MIVEPKVREFICTTAHPTGCYENVKRQIAYVKDKGTIEGPKESISNWSIDRIWSCKPYYSCICMSGFHNWSHV